jgi:hypothetical protein
VLIRLSDRPTQVLALGHTFSMSCSRVCQSTLRLFGRYRLRSDRKQ